MESGVHKERRGAILEVTLDRPPANAINDAVTWDIYRAFQELQDDPELTVGILTGGGDRIFSAGWDLKEVASAEDAAAATDEAVKCPGGFGGITEFWGLRKPVIAAVNGWAVGGGFELALASDVILASDNARFMLPEMQRGFLPDAGGVQTLPRRIPYNVAMEMLLTGREMPAEEAKHWGLASDVVPLEKLMPRARTLAESVAEGAPLALQALKEVMPALITLPLEEAFGRTKRGRSGLPAYEKMLNSEDFAEGPRAFAEKRAPNWKGR